MRKALTIICLALILGAPVSAQDTTPRTSANAANKTQATPEMQEAERLNSEVLRLFREGKYDEALPIAKRVLEIREKSSQPEGYLLAYALVNLGSIYMQKEKRGDAEPLFKRALEIVEKQDGSDSDFAADIVTQLGFIRSAARDYDVARVLLLRALSTRQRLHGASDASLVPALLNLTDVSFISGDGQQGLPYLSRAASIVKSSPPRKDLVTAKRFKAYLCPIMGRRGFGDDELSSAIWNAVWRLEEPEIAAEQEREEKEREARGEPDKKLVEGGVLNGRVTSKPAPDYPIAAKQQRVMGTVIVHITVDEAGKVINAEAVCGHPLLARAAVDAARSARFTPTLLSGKPVKVGGVITYNFILQ